MPLLLIRGGRKFHIRTYVAVVEDPQYQDLLEIYVYNRHELRVAGVPVAAAGGGDDKGGNGSATPSPGRDPRAHITNGAVSDSTERVLLQSEEELVRRNIQEKVEAFVAETFAKRLLPDIARRVSYSLSQDGFEEDGQPPIKRFVVAG